MSFQTSKTVHLEAQIKRFDEIRELLTLHRQQGYYHVQVQKGTKNKQIVHVTSVVQLIYKATRILCVQRKQKSWL